MMRLRNPWLLLPLAILAGAAWHYWSVDLSWSALAGRRAGLRAAVQSRPAVAALLYVAAYALAVAVSLPAGGVLTAVGGMLFGAWPGGALAVTGAWLGAMALFLLARFLLRPVLTRRFGAVLARVEPGLRQDAFWYLLSLRLAPVVPFWLANLAPALLGMRFGPYAGATLIGIVPVTFTLASIGAGLAGTLDQGGAPDLSALLGWPVLGPLLALAALSLAPIVIRRVLIRRGPAGRHG